MEFQSTIHTPNDLSDNDKNNKQIFYTFLFNFRNYSLINIQRRDVELNILLLGMNNFDIKQKETWNICFVISHQHQTRSRKIKANRTQQILVTTQVIFVKTELQHTLLVNHFILLLLIFFSEIVNP